MPPDRPNRYACVLYATIILLPPIPPQLKILYETLNTTFFKIFYALTFLRNLVHH